VLSRGVKTCAVVSEARREEGRKKPTFKQHRRPAYIRIKEKDDSSQRLLCLDDLEAPPRDSQTRIQVTPR
jgi:hypothetical protein